MKKFKIVRKGYCVAEVDEFVKENNELKNLLCEKNIAISEFKADIIKLNYDIASLKGREDKVFEALKASIEKAKEINFATDMQYKLENERLKLFRVKWEQFCDENKSKAGVKEKREKVTNFLNIQEKDLLSIMKRDLKITEDCDIIDDAQQQYIDESKRILDLARKATVSDNFNLNDLNKEHDLLKLCEEII